MVAPLVIVLSLYAPLCLCDPLPLPAAFDDGSWKPSKEYDDGSWKPSKEYDDGSWKPSKEYDDSSWKTSNEHDDGSRKPHNNGLSNLNSSQNLGKENNPHFTTVDSRHSNLEDSQSDGLTIENNHNEKEKIEASSGNQKVVCYFDDWMSGWAGNGQFNEDMILDAPCTHIVYSFAKLDPNSNKMNYESQPRLINKLKENGIKVMLAVGGAVDSKGPKYSNMASEKENRKVFIDSVVEIINSYGFDGFDVDWEYPTCTEAPGDCGSLPQDKENFVSLIRELRQALGDKILTIATDPLDNVISKAFNIPALTNDIDWFNIMTYDLHGSWDGKALHHSPLFANDQISLEGSVKLYKSLGVPAEKIVVGTPTYGRSLRLQDPSRPEYETPVTGQGDAGPYTKEAGLLSMVEICEKVKNSGWKTGKGSEGVGPYAYGDGNFVGFDDPEMAKKKAEFAKEQGLGGIMVWSLGNDDHKNVCGCGKFPVVTSLYNVLVDSKPVQECQI